MSCSLQFTFIVCHSLHFKALNLYALGWIFVLLNVCTVHISICVIDVSALHACLFMQICLLDSDTCFSLCKSFDIQQSVNCSSVVSIYLIFLLPVGYNSLCMYCFNIYWYCYSVVPDVHWRNIIPRALKPQYSVTKLLPSQLQYNAKNALRFEYLKGNTSTSLQCMHKFAQYARHDVHCSAIRMST